MPILPHLPFPVTVGGLMIHGIRYFLAIARNRPCELPWNRVLPPRARLPDVRPAETMFATT